MRGGGTEVGTKVIGLLGGIGSGKSFVAGIFAELGSKVIDADAICTELHATPETRAAVRKRWGDVAFGKDGELDRVKLANIVFSDPAELDELDRIMHPKVTARIRAEVREYRRSGTPALCAIDAPLLLETGLVDLCDATAFVECEPSVRCRRLRDNRGWGPDEIQRREARQEPLDRKREAADFVIANHGDREAARKNIEQIVSHLVPNGE